MKKVNLIVLGLGLFATSSAWSQTELTINQWSGSTTIDLATVQNFTFEYDGYMTVNKIGAGSEYFDLQLITNLKIETVTGVDAQLFQNSFAGAMAFPNPIQESTKVSFDLAEASNIKIELLKADGSVVSVSEMDGLAGKNTSEVIGTENLSAGTYFVKISNSKSVETIKLIKF
jgi:hypothetical protein